MPFMSTSHIYGPVLEAIRSGRTVLPCCKLHYCVGEFEFQVIKNTYTDDEMRQSMGNFKRTEHPCTLRSGYKEEVFYYQEPTDDNPRPFRLAHDTQDTAVKGITPQRMRQPEQPNVAIDYLRSHWSELAPKFAAAFTLLLPKGVQRCADTQDNVIDNLKSISTESALIDEIADGTACYALFRTYIEKKRYNDYDLYFLHKTPTLCLCVSCKIDGYYMCTSLMQRPSPDEPWQEVQSEDDSDTQQDIESCREFYGLFVAMQQMEADMAIFGHTVLPGAMRSFGLDRYLNKAGFPVRIFNGY